MTIEQANQSAQPMSDAQASQLAQILSVQQEQLKALQEQTERVVGAIQVLQQRSGARDVAINAITMSFGENGRSAGQDRAGIDPGGDHPVHFVWHRFGGSWRNPCRDVPCGVLTETPCSRSSVTTSFKITGAPK